MIKVLYDIEQLLSAKGKEKACEKNKFIKKYIIISKKLINHFLLNLCNLMKKNYFLSELKDTDVFFSPCFKIPEIINQQAQIKKIVILYDAIPLVLQEYKVDNKHWFSQLCQSLNINDTYFAISEYTKNDFIKYFPFLKQAAIHVIPLAMPRLYKTLDFYLMLSDVEGGPVTVIEAMASKTPVLATNIGVVQDIGEDKKNIILIDNKNSKDILQKILYYKEHQTELDDIINNAYKTAQNMTYDKTFAPLEQVYNKFLCGRKLTGALLDFDTLNKHFMRKAYSVQDEKKQRNYVPWKLFGLSRNTEICKFYFFGIPIFSSRQGTKKNGDIKLKHYFCGLPYFVKEKANFKKIYKFLGLSRTKYKNILRKTFSFSKQSLTSSDIKGLSKPEKWGRWSDGKTVDMKIKLPTDKGDLRCCFVLKPFLNEKIKQQIVSVSINDKFIVDWIFELGKPSPKTEFIIPKSLLKKSGKTFFSFKIKNPVSPWELGLAEDRRNLGIGFISLQITPAIVNETSLQKWWKKVKAKILPKPPVDYAPAFQALSKELIGLKGLVESLQKEIKTLENEQVMTQKMLVDEKTLLQKKRRF